MLPGERKSVEPMAAITSPERTAAQHHRCFISWARADGRTRRSWPRFGRWCSRRLSDTARLKLGSSGRVVQLRRPGGTGTA
nr:hypothetical protein [Bradyrhizobium ivorense]